MIICVYIYIYICIIYIYIYAYTYIYIYNVLLYNYIIVYSDRLRLLTSVDVLHNDMSSYAIIYTL